MTINRLLVPLSIGVDFQSALGSGFRLAEQFNAHLDATFFKFPLDNALAFDDVEGFPLDLINQRTEEQEELAAEARQHFDTELGQRNMDYLEIPTPTAKPGAAWRVVDEAPYWGVTHGGASYDLIVVGRSLQGSSPAYRDLIEAALFQTGRPVLVPSATPSEITGGVVLATWNRSAESARAISAGMPFFEAANRVVVFSVATGAKQGPPASEIGTYLDFHSVKNEVVEVSPDHRPVGEIILSEANERGAGLIVMGAYSHSRLRELLLGGVTEYILQNSSLPFLMVR